MKYLQILWGVFTLVSMQRITLLIPGLIDVPLEDLGGKTALEVAKAPLFQAANSEIPTDQQGLGCALLQLLGAPQTAESVLETLALGIRLCPGQFAFSARLISQGEGVIVDVSDELVCSREGQELYKFLNGALRCSFLPLEGPRAVLITQDPDLAAIPKHPFLNPVDCLGKKLSSFARAPLLRQIEEALSTHEINEMRADLEEDPINGILLSDGGSAHSCFVAQREEALFIGRTGVLLGAAKWAGWQTHRLKREESRFDHIQEIFALLPQLSHQEILIEIPYLWDATYKGDLLEKIKTLEWLDRNLLSHLPQATVHPLVQVDIRKGRILTCPER